MGDSDGDWYAGNREKSGHCSLLLQQQQQLHLLCDSSFQPSPSGPSAEHSALSWFQLQPCLLMEVVSYAQPLSSMPDSEFDYSELGIH